MLAFLGSNRTCSTLRLAQGTCQRFAQVSLRLAQVAHAMSSLAALVAARAELLVLNLRSGMAADDPRFLRLAETSVESILQQIHNLALIPSATIVEAMKHMVGSPVFHQDAQDRIRDAMNAKVHHNGRRTMPQTASTRPYCSRTSGCLIRCTTWSGFLERSLTKSVRNWLCSRGSLGQVGSSTGRSLRTVTSQPWRCFTKILKPL